MSVRTTLLPVLDLVDQVNGPAYTDFRTTTCQIISRVWTSGVIGRGGAYGFVDSVKLQLPNYIRIRHVTEREVAQSGGRLEHGSVVVGPVRPPWTGLDGSTGGFSQAQLAPNDDSGTQIIYRLTSLDPTDQTTTGINGDYRRYDIKRDKSLRFMLFLTRTNATPGP